MAQLYSQYGSGVQLTAGPTVGSVMGVSGINPIIDRLNSISSDNNLVTGSFISGTNTQIYATNIVGSNISGTNTAVYATGTISGTTATIYATNLINGLVGSNGIEIYNSSGVSLELKRKYYSISPVAFIDVGDADTIRFDNGGQPFLGIMSTGNPILSCPLNLPHGGSLISCTIYADATAFGTDWNISRYNLISAAKNVMASGDFNSEANFINTRAIVDNGSYVYTLETSTMDSGGKLYGGIIAYAERG